MIFICGYRSSGKSTVGKILEEENYWVFDVGPFLRNYYDANIRMEGEISFEELLQKGKGESGNRDWLPDWVPGVLQAEVIKRYEDKKDKKDLVLLGLRSESDIDTLYKLLEGKVFPSEKKFMIFLDVDFELGLKRYLERNPKNTEEDFWRQMKVEGAWGLEDLKASGHAEVLSNKGDPDELKGNLKKMLR
jgi:dephospho-CoA kinase